MLIFVHRYIDNYNEWNEPLLLVWTLRKCFVHGERERRFYMLELVVMESTEDSPPYGKKLVQTGRVWVCIGALAGLHSFSNGRSALLSLLCHRHVTIISWFLLLLLCICHAVLSARISIGIIRTQCLVFLLFKCNFRFSFFILFTLKVLVRWIFLLYKHTHIRYEAVGIYKCSLYTSGDCWLLSDSLVALSFFIGPADSLSDTGWWISNHLDSQLVTMWRRLAC